MKCPMCDGTGTSNTCVNGTFKPCSFCDGTGEFDPNDVDRFNAVDVIKVMEMVKKPLTNFSRITASTEALAEFLGEYAMPPCGHIVLCKECPLNGKSCLDNNVATDKDAWLVWLKQESE